MTADQRTLGQFALSWEEYRLACERLPLALSHCELDAHFAAAKDPRGV